MAVFLLVLSVILYLDVSSQKRKFFNSKRENSSTPNEKILLYLL